MSIDTVNYIKRLAPSSGRFRICTRCVMDSSAAPIEFDANGACNYCREFTERLGRKCFPSSAARDQAKDELVAQIKRHGHGRKYDCVVGVSGGADSTWALRLAVNEGLRPLAVHMDNGWNLELSANNIALAVRRCGVDLHTHVIDWEEYRDLMQAFFAADVIDIELLYDNAMLAVNHDQAIHRQVGHILTGANLSTEGMIIPPNWNWFKWDRHNIYRLCHRFGNGRRIRTFPAIGLGGYLRAVTWRRIRWVSFLDYYDYDKAACIKTMQAELGFKPYPYKHYESVFTRFYQGFILPVKFGVDKRKFHFSNLVVSGQMTRDAAMRQLEELPYPSANAVREDLDYFLKKMGWSEAQLAEYLARPEKPHAAYGTEKPWWDLASALSRRLRRVRSLLPR